MPEMRRAVAAVACAACSGCAPFAHDLVRYSGKLDEMSETLHYTPTAPNNFTCYSTSITGSPSAKCHTHHTIAPCTRAVSEHNLMDPNDAKQRKNIRVNNHAAERDEHAANHIATFSDTDTCATNVKRAVAMGTSLISKSTKNHTHKTTLMNALSGRGRVKRDATHVRHLAEASIRMGRSQCSSAAHHGDAKTRPNIKPPEAFVIQKLLRTGKTPIPETKTPTSFHIRPCHGAKTKQKIPVIDAKDARRTTRLHR